MTIFIAEISNHHDGDLDKAKALILAAKESGAHIVKGQAFTAGDMEFAGSMPMGFYKKCELSLSNYKDLISFSRSIGVLLFFTIVSREFKVLEQHQVHKKLYAKRAGYCSERELSEYDVDNSFISLCDIRADFRSFKKATLLYATKYLGCIDPRQYDFIKSFYKKDIGISLNTNDHKNLDVILKNNKIPVIEKHFFLGDEISFEGKVYRDCKISYTPEQFKELVDIVNA